MGFEVVSISDNNCACPLKTGKRGMLGHPKGLCWLLWFLGLCSMFVHYV